MNFQLGLQSHSQPLHLDQMYQTVKFFGTAALFGYKRTQFSQDSNQTVKISASACKANDR